MHLQPPVQELSIRNHTVHVQDPGPAHVPPHFPVPVPFQDRVPQLNAPTFHQPLACESSIGHKCTVQVQNSAPISPRLLVCPKCGVQFHRRQERDRHLQSHFAHFLFCPVPRCPWRGNRLYVFRAHWERNHQEHGQAPMRRQNEIYNPDPLVKLVNWKALTVESACEISLAIVGIRAEQLNKVGVWEGAWGSRAKFGK
ncbi:hypothetical protein BC826DRAFT_1015810 [Russula brevipes]|nr:hypothetical protein BC826DRAFT_1015810 [Russula brevipes]